MQVNFMLSNISSCRIWLILDAGHGHLGTPSAHLAALWITGLASALLEWELGAVACKDVALPM